MEYLWPFRKLVPAVVGSFWMMRSTRRFFRLFVLLVAGLGCQPVSAQRGTTTSPIVGLRSADPDPVFLHGGEVVTAPGQSPIRADVLIDGTSIIAVGVSINVPGGAMKIDVTGKRIYAALIDAMHEVELPGDVTTDSAGYWNANVTPEYRAAWVADKDSGDEKKLRSQGFAARLLAPRDGVVKGSSCLVLLVDTDDPLRVLRADMFQHATLTVPRTGRRDRYPNSPMGATALVRQSFYDATWYVEALRAFEVTPTLSRPEPNTALQALGSAARDGTIVMDAANERMAIRADHVASEFSLRTVLRGSGREYRAVDEIAATGRAILVPVDFPDAPSAKTVHDVRKTPLVNWLDWHFAPENPKRLAEAGVTFCLTTDGLSDPKNFLKQVRTAVARGLDPAVALAAVTTTPAELLGVNDKIGRVKPGMLASLIVADGDLMADETKVLETWVAGKRFVIADDTKEEEWLIGDWAVKLPVGKESVDAVLEITANRDKVSGKLHLKETENDKEDAEDKDKDKVKVKVEDEDEQKAVPSVELENVIRTRDRLTATLKLRSLDEALENGSWQLTVLTIESNSDDGVFAELVSPSFQTRSIKLSRIKRDEEADPDEKAIEQEKTNQEETVAKSEPFEIPLTYPLGAYGLTGPTKAPEGDVVFRDATVWTCGPHGKLDQADVWIRGGKIVGLGNDLGFPKSAKTIDAKGKHITPGLIDCHSHIATDGGVNESGQAVTAEVRIADFIDNSDINIYRQLAGGVTTSHILHGSANPIGGQSQVIKFLWGESFDAMKMSSAPGGIKFALGENVKRSQDRYPNTRMGVEQMLRDQLLAARQYEARWNAWNSGKRDGLPPRRDLQLDALVEVQRGDRFVHCHSYRQDEIVATLEVLEEFNIQIGTLQHILEGYKVADRMAAHGAMASSFADWWAYKFEVYDAIPYNGILMHNAGVIVSFNSDDAELARHLNTEAGKAIKYGGVPEQEAIKFVTLNPAKQLRIDDRVGSLETGKDADLVIWSGPPMSTTTRCEQTWINGRPYFTLETDLAMRARDRELKAKLVQLSVIKKPESKDDKESKPEITEESRWVRFDVYCNAAGTKPANIDAADGDYNESFSGENETTQFRGVQP